jgi:hypothetical protein
MEKYYLLHMLLPSDTSIITPDFRLSGLNEKEWQSDNGKFRIIQNTNEKDEGKYELNFKLDLLLNY